MKVKINIWQKKLICVYRCLVVVFFITWCTCVAAQKPIFNQLTSEQGLSQNTVLAIGQDAQGFIWLGTRHGLNRYDGYQVKTFIHEKDDPNSISDNYINAICYDKNSGLWVGTERGLNLYNPLKDHFRRFPLSPTIPNAIISAIVPGDKNFVWVASKRGLFRIDHKTGKSVSASALGLLTEAENQNIRTVFIDSQKNMWIALQKKVVCVKKDRRSKTIFRSVKSDPSSLSDEVVTAFYEDSEKNLWLGTLNGLNLYNPASATFTHYNNQPGNPLSLGNNNVRAITENRKGDLWIATLDGLSVMDKATKRFTTHRFDVNDPRSLSQNSLHSLFTDDRGSIWIGTFYGGVNMVYNDQLVAPMVFDTYRYPRISSNIIGSIAVDVKNNLWIGTEGGGLNYLNRATGEISRYSSDLRGSGLLSSNLVKKIFIDRQQNVWVGTHGGAINVMYAGETKFRQVLPTLPFLKNRHSEVVALTEDDDGLIWIGAHTGLFAFERQGTQLQPAHFQHALNFFDQKNISALLKEAEQHIFIGTLNGLFLFDKERRKVEEIAIRNGNKNINCLYKDSKGTIWLGLYYGGLARYHPDQKAVFPVENMELPNQNVVGILEDHQQNIWISTGNGLVKYHPATQSIKVYTKSDGLPGNEFNYNAFYKNNNGEMFFGGTSGLISFFPDKIKENQTAAPLVFTGLRVLNSNIRKQDAPDALKTDINYVHQIRLKYGQNTFSISFALLNFIKSNKNIYAYKIDGIHQDWIKSKTPVATFTNLAPGSYKLLIRGANNDGIWSNARPLNIVILPPIWQTWWAYLLYAAAALLIIFFIVRFFYLRALLARDHELHELKLNFFTNISHEIRTHLTLIQAPVEGMERDHKENPGLMRQVAHLKNNTERLLHLVTELMDFRKAETNSLTLHVGKYNLVSFLNTVFETFEDLSLERNIQSGFAHTENDISLYFDGEQMAKVVYNLLMNAYKFTPDGGMVNMAVEDKKEKVMIHITDNGKGIEPHNIDKLFTNFFQAEDSQNSGYGIGLALSKSIVTLHSGSLTVKSTPATNISEGYTRFTITLLKGKDHFSPGQMVTEKMATQWRQPPPRPASPIAGLSKVEQEIASQYQVLVVEDMASLRDLLNDTLTQLGYHVMLCKNGVEGWEAATTSIPDIIISDVMMPEMDGFTLCNKLKNDVRSSHIPVILLTAKSTQGDHIEGLGTGADIYLTKPFSTKVLALSVKNLLAAREKMRSKFTNEFTVSPSNTVVEFAEKEFLEKLIATIEAHVDEPEFGVEALASKIAMSQSVLYKKLRAVADMSVNEFIKTIRLKRAAQLLESQQYHVSEISLMVGFYDSKYFSREFKKQFGVTPSTYSRSARQNPS
ncbi:two-component regulator propeller domain-containing protein [Niabella insulamsoli]|uniref:two-component regulator propeller domain-containing protein n=1 Tax=Niabella insulamsoli TaxID=3144874 RepID=UPI0031FD997F